MSLTPSTKSRTAPTAARRGPERPAATHAADGGSAAEGRRLEGQELASRRQRRFDFGQRRAAARGDDQFGRLVADDAAVAARIEHLARQRAAVEVLAAAAADAQRLSRLAARMRSAKLLDRSSIRSARARET